jgi:adenine specific DNA methylase Mod
VDNSGGNVADTLYFGDNLPALRSGLVKPDSVDLVYLDPPFNSNANYNVLFRSPTGSKSRAQIQAFEDTWHWGEEAELAYTQAAESRTGVATAIRALKSFLGTNDMMAYLAMMAVRLIELRQVMKPTGSLYLHCDPTASHYLKILLDGVFGPDKFRNEIIWKRHSAHSSAKRYGPVHDVLLFYSKGESFTWTEPRLPYADEYLDRYYKYDDGDGRLYWRNSLTAAGTRSGSSGRPWHGHDPASQGAHWKFTTDNLDALDAAGKIYWPPGGGWPQIKRYRDELKGLAVSDLWDDIDKINPAGNERLGYPTQKPLALLERIIGASSNPGDLVLDPFCGCGTAVHAAQRLGRQWIGIDITHVAIQIIEDRLRRYFPTAKPKVIGRPTDLDGAEGLAKRDKHEFQSWAVWLAGGWPVGGVAKKGMDRGVDGELYFKMSPTFDGRAIISVKGGQHIGPSMIRDLKGTREGEEAEMAIFVSLEEPSAEMTAAAASGGFLPDSGDDPTPRIQMLTVRELLAGKKPRIPPLYDTLTATAAGRVAARVRPPKVPTPEEIRRQPGFKLPIRGGRAQQKPLPIEEPVLVAQPATARRRRLGR